MIVISRRHEEEIFFTCGSEKATVKIIKPGNRFEFRLPKHGRTERRGNQIFFNLSGHEISIEVVRSNARRTRVGIFCPEEVRVERGPSLSYGDDDDGRPKQAGPNNRPQLGQSRPERWYPEWSDPARTAR